jgi:glycosyltransferase involved in cell wall biosynthesis
MKVAVLVRTLNETNRIGKFCAAYKDADAILVADGGSIDNTIEIARQFKNVQIGYFNNRMKLKNGYWRNPDSAHMNFLIDWAKSCDFDWVIMDDCDCRPNFLVKRDYRMILENTKTDIVMVPKIYLWLETQHLSYLARPFPNHIDYAPSLWAWRNDLDLRTIHHPPAIDFSINGEFVTTFEVVPNLKLYPPYVLLHHSWETEEQVKIKHDGYRKSGLIPGQLHPLEFGGPLEDLEWFMKEEE